jgi:hypothetical protein
MLLNHWLEGRNGYLASMQLAVVNAERPRKATC